MSAHQHRPRNIKEAKAPKVIHKKGLTTKASLDSKNPNMDGRRWNFYGQRQFKNKTQE